MQTLTFNHPRYRNKIVMIQVGTTVEFYSNNVLVEQHEFNSENGALACFINNKRFYMGYDNNQVMLRCNNSASLTTLQCYGNKKLCVRI